MTNEETPKRKKTWRQRLLRMLLLGLICYVGVCIVLALFENWLVFPATKARREWLPPPSPDVEDVWLETKSGPKAHAWWWRHPNSQGALLFCHGNAGNLSHRGMPIQFIRKKWKVSVLIFDYLGYGKSEGKPHEQGCYESAHAAYDWLVDKQKTDPQSIVLFGDSLGGAVAIELAANKPHRALVAIKTFTALPDVAQHLYPLLPVRWLMRNRFPSLERIGQCDRPIFIGHGTTDRLIPFDQGKKLYEAANEPKQFYAMESVGHNDPPPDEFFDQVDDFLEKHAPEAARQIQQSGPGEE